MKVLKIVCSTWDNSSRDKRELSVCKELGMSTITIAKSKDNVNRQETVDGFDVIRLTTRPVGIFMPNFINRLVSIFIWIYKARKIHAEIISGHDIEGLAIGYLSTLFCSNKPKLIYDSHEFEIGSSRNLNKPVKLWLVKKIEKFLIKKSSLSIFVSDSIAKKVIETYRISNNIIVVRNIPSYWRKNNDIDSRISVVRNKFQAQTSNSKYIVMYHGAIFPHRGIENMLKAISDLSDVGCVILGDGDNNYKNELIRLCDTLKIRERVTFHNYVPLDNLIEYVGAADIGTALMEPITKSYYYCLPNKLFENIQSLTPLVVSDFPELRYIVEKYKIGIAVDPLNTKNITNAFISILYDDEKKREFKNHLISAKKELCWEKEKEILKKAYKELM